MQERLEAREKRNEKRAAVLRAKLLNTVVALHVDVSAVRRPRIILHRWARPVHRQIKRWGHILELPQPVRFYFCTFRGCAMRRLHLRIGAKSNGFRQSGGTSPGLRRI